MGRAGDYGAGRMAPGGPDAQPNRVVQAYGVIQAKIAMLDAKDRWKAKNKGKGLSSKWV